MQPPLSLTNHDVPHGGGGERESLEQDVTVGG